MPRSSPPPKATRSNEPERMWALDTCLVTLSGLVLYLIITRLSFEDPRWLYNAWTYAVAVPAIAILLAISLRAFANRFVQKSVQIGFLFSVCLHLVLLILAINVVIFAKYFPDAFAGVKPERSPIHKTVPEHIFKSPRETATAPDWSEPVESQTASRVMPEEQRQLPPLEQTRPRLEMPKPQPQRQRIVKRTLMRRVRPAQTRPQPANTPSMRARQQANDSQQAQPLEAPNAPVVPIQAQAQARSVERELTRSDRRQASSNAAAMRSMMADPSPSSMSLRVPNTTPLSEARSRTTELPQVGEVGLSQQRRQRTRANQMQPAGAAPSPQTVAVARSDASAERMLSPVEVPMTQRGRTAGAQLLAGENASSMLESTSVATSGADLARNNVAARAGIPSISAGDAMRAPGRSPRASTGIGFAPAGTPTPGSLASNAGGDAAIGNQGTGNQATGQATSQDSMGTGDVAIQDRTGSGDLDASRSARRGGGGASPNLSDVVAAGPAFEIDAPLGMAGIGNRVSPTAGLMPAPDIPDVTAMELSDAPRPRREVGGPAVPAGTEIAAVESFNRRMMRTQGGALPTPAGKVLPPTEQAIERGLAYLASTQNDDGSWSLQGHGEEVLLQSDTAATGLCLLAFQGAGYTHRQHQYADTVSKGLRFLLKNQRTTGDLFRPENALSNRNVALYSHGIAALALSEAYGMTQDPELKPAAQLALDFIVETQHPQRGGWRYTPGISSDTSVSGWMMMSLKSGELAGLEVPPQTYDGVNDWLALAQSPDRPDRYRYNPFAPNTPSQRHGRIPTPTMTAVGMLMRMYSGWRREREEMQSAADYLLDFRPSLGDTDDPKRDGYYWYYATQVMFHMGGDHWEKWNEALNPLLIEGQIRDGAMAGSWDPVRPVPDRWSPHAGRLYVTTMNLLNLEVFYRHLPIYDDTAE